MLLTGKCKEDFLKWSILNRSIIVDYHENHIISDIIEWFDSVGIYIGIEPYIGGGEDVYYAKIVYRMMTNNFIDTWVDVENTMYSPIELYFSNRREATKQAIIKASQIYNEKFSR